MGIIVLSIAILPLLGMGAVQLARAESPGPMPDRLTPRFRETAKRLWIVYVALTVVEMILLWFGDMTLFEAVNHGTHDHVDWWLQHERRVAQRVQQLLAMDRDRVHGAWPERRSRFTSGRCARHRSTGRRTEVRVYLGVTARGCGPVMIVGTWGGSVHDTIRDALVHRRRR